MFPDCGFSPVSSLQIKWYIMYFFWQAAFSVLLRSNTAELSYQRAWFLHTNVQTPGSFHLAWAHYCSLFVFGEEGLWQLLSVPRGIETAFCFRHRINDMMETQPLSMHRMEEWNAKSLKVLNLNRTNGAWEKSQFWWLFSFCLLSLHFITLPEEVWLWVWLVVLFRSWDTCFYYRQLERHLHQCDANPQSGWTSKWGGSNLLPLVPSDSEDSMTLSPSSTLAVLPAQLFSCHT